MSRAHQEYEYELEGEYEGEYEGEFEGEEFLGTLGRIAGGLFGGQGEGEGEFEFELEGEGEFEGEGEYESEEFLRRIAGLARRAVRSPALRRIGLTAARTALRGLGDVAGAVGGAPGSTGAQIGQGLGTQAAGLLGGLLPQSEFEYEGEYEGEGEMNPQQRLYNEALMEHLGHAAAEAESEAEAEAFIGALVPIAARLIPRIAPAVMRAAPGLIRGAANVASTLRRSPATRPLVRAIPTIVRRTAAGMARQTAAGRPVTSQAAVRTLAQQTAQVIGNPRQCAGALQRARAVDRNFHRATGQRTARPAPACAGCTARRASAAARTNGHGAPCAACGSPAR